MLIKKFNRLDENGEPWLGQSVYYVSGAQVERLEVTVLLICPIFSELTSEMYDCVEYLPMSSEDLAPIIGRRINRIVIPAC